MQFLISFRTSVIMNKVSRFIKLCGPLFLVDPRDYFLLIKKIHFVLKVKFSRLYTSHNFIRFDCSYYRRRRLRRVRVRKRNGKERRVRWNRWGSTDENFVWKIFQDKSRKLSFHCPGSPFIIRWIFHCPPKPCCEIEYDITDEFRRIDTECVRMCSELLIITVYFLLKMFSRENQQIEGVLVFRISF